MADKIVNGKIIQAVYTTEELSQEPLCNIVIDEGFVVYEKCDNGQIKLKIGDGTNTWNGLDYIGSNSEINDEDISTSSTYSSNKIMELLGEIVGFVFDASSSITEINLEANLVDDSTTSFYYVYEQPLNEWSSVYSIIGQEFGVESDNFPKKSGGFLLGSINYNDRPLHGHLSCTYKINGGDYKSGVIHVKYDDNSIVLYPNETVDSLSGNLWIIMSGMLNHPEF